eukprot:tig00020685_g12959.t1
MKHLYCLSERPYVATSPPDLLAKDFFTPTDHFFVRNHHPVPPEVEAAQFLLEVDVWPPRRFSLDALRSRFRTVCLPATLQCAAGRRAGPGCLPGAVSTGAFAGARLSRGGAGAGSVPAEEAARLHVRLEGRDRDPATGEPYAASPLGREHGAPLRAVVPGASAERSVKWLARIGLVKGPVAGFWEGRGYRGALPRDLDAAPATAAICGVEVGPRAAAAAAGAPRSALVRGFAFALEGRRVGRVEVSADEGRSWRPAELEGPPAAEGAPAPAAAAAPAAYAWVPWRASLELPAAPGPGPRPAALAIVCRLLDAAVRPAPPPGRALRLTRIPLPGLQGAELRPLGGRPRVVVEAP